MKVYILAAGDGKRCTPYTDTRSKCMIPVANEPVLARLCGHVLSAGDHEIVVAAPGRSGAMRNYFLKEPRVSVAEVGSDIGTAGTASSLLSVWPGEEPAVVLFGDVLLHRKDVQNFLSVASESGSDTVRLLTAQIEEDESGDLICAAVDGGTVTEIVGHPRGKPARGEYHRVAGFVLPADFHRYLEACPDYFPSSEVGMMVPAERYLEGAVEVRRRGGGRTDACIVEYPSVDIDKPWHILDANMLMVRTLCRELESDAASKDEPAGDSGNAAVSAAADGTKIIDDSSISASIDESASIEGRVRLGKGSRIGKNVIIRGNVIAGDHVTIDSGAIIDGDVLVGDESFIGNGCYIEGGSCIGRRCVVSHAAELSGVIFDNVYLYHYMEICGVIGENTDIGAATVCGTLRFDDGRSVIRIRGRKERPKRHSNATYIGDYCRTGVNATIMPGHRIGPYSIVGAGVVLEEDLAPGTGIRVRQELERFEWGPERYGW